MRKFVLISLAFLLVATPSFAELPNCFGDKLKHNINRLTAGFESFGELNSLDVNNYQVKISVALKIGQLREVIKSGKNLTESKTVDSPLYSSYISALDDFDKGLDDLTTGVRQERAESIAQGKQHFLDGIKKLAIIRNQLRKAEL